MTGFRYDPDRCPECGHPAVYALDQDGYEFYLDPRAEGGNFAALDDANRIAWCRPAGPGTQLQLGEYLVTPHACPLASVVAITAAPSLRPRPRPSAGGRTASAR